MPLNHPITPALLADPKIFQQNRLPFHAHFADQTSLEMPLTVSLDGAWNFRYAENLTAPFSDWDTLTVPGFIQMQSLQKPGQPYGTPHYVNTQYPWDGHEKLHPGEIPQDYNPIGEYQRSFTLPESWASCYLRLNGADSAAAHNTWRAISAGDGYYYLYSQVGDQITYLMDISGGKADNGTNAALWTKSSREQAQQFLFALNEDGSYTIYTKASNLKSCIEVENASKSSGANVQQYESNGNACQHWILEETAAAGVKLDTSQVYQFQNANSALYLEVKDASAEAGANVQQWSANDNDCQNWTLKEFGDGYYYILSRLGDGKTYYLDVAEGKGDDGTNIQIFTNTKTSAQLFKFIPNPDGTYYIVTRASKDKGALGVAAASKEQGANVLQWTKNGSMDQMWNITAIGAIPTPVTTTEPPVVTTEAPTETTTADRLLLPCI